MKPKKIDRSEIMPGFMYLWRQPDGKVCPVWLDEEDHNYINEWEDGGWELSALKGDFFGPVVLSK